MFLRYQNLALYAIIPPTILALDIVTNQNSINQPNLSDLVNITTNASLKTREIYCDSSLVRPQVSSCEDALAQVPTLNADPTFKFGPRGQADLDVWLPARWISYLLADGQCIIHISQTSSPSHVKYNDIGVAAHDIQKTCIAGKTPPRGGRATNLGLERNLLVTTQGYTPPYILCQSQPRSLRPSSSACAFILATMNASTSQIEFVARGPPRADAELLPRVLTEPTGKCTFTIRGTALVNRASWYEIWEAAVALDGMCVRGGKTGKASFLGERGYLSVGVRK